LAVAVDPGLYANVFCRELLPGAKEPAVRRWLASAQLADIAGCDLRQLRATIVDDCGASDLDAEALEEDLILLADVVQRLQRRETPVLV
jgi:hypothetical protein